ncbi:MAG: phenylacetate--CoA ligase [Hyphomicrobiales bacterium]|nr:MAG: phenylacetate--CoA ligase [Hyphomicrobiales bacterium]
MFQPEIESLPWAEQRAVDEPAYRKQLDYLFDNSQFYRDKLGEAGFRTAASAGALADIVHLPFTEKDELRASRSDANPIGTHIAVPLEKVCRVFSTSGTTGIPSYIPLTPNDLERWVLTSSRSYAAAGVQAGERIVSTYNAGPFVAGAALDAFNRLGLCHIPVGSGNTERLMAAVKLLNPQILGCTPSYAFHLSEWAKERGIDLKQSSVEHILVAGEPGGGEPAMRGQLEEVWGAKVTEAMGIGDISVSLWGECEHQNGMHFSGRGFVHIELIDPETGASVPMEDGATGELVLTHLAREAAPLLRFRTRDHVMFWNSPCPCGRTSPRVRCIGRTDDMLIVRGVNLFPSAVREVVNRFAPKVSGVIAVRPKLKGVKQEPPLPVVVELGEGVEASAELADSIQKEIRAVLVVNAAIRLVAKGVLPRSDYKSKILDFSDAV